MRQAAHRFCNRFQSPVQGLALTPIDLPPTADRCPARFSTFDWTCRQRCTGAPRICLSFRSSSSWWPKGLPGVGRAPAAPPSMGLAVRLKSRFMPFMHARRSRPLESNSTLGRHGSTSTSRKALRVLADQFEPVSARTAMLSPLPRRGRATRRGRRRTPEGFAHA
jgi:hypothetical protein